MACLFLFNACHAFSQDFAFDPNTSKAYRLALDLRFDEAKKLLPSPTTPQQLYVISFAEALELIVTENPRQFSAYESAFEERTSRKSRRRNADEMLLQAEMHLQWAFIYLKFGKELDAAFRLRQAYQYTEEIRKKYPEYHPILKTSGLLNVMIGSVPEKYRWVLGLLGMEGSVNTGLSEMKELIGTQHLFSFETTLWHAFTLGFMLQQPEKAIVEMNYLLNMHPENPLATFMMANFHIKNGASEEALKYLFVEKEERTPIVYMHYLRGEIFLHKAQYQDAVYEYSWFLQRYNGQNYVKDAHYKIGLCYWLDGRQDDAIVAFREAETNGKENTEADKHAARNLASTDMPSIPLTKMRFYTDGGYYREAEALMDQIDPQTLTVKKHQVEFHYRKARLNHKLGRTKEAESSYKETITLARDNEWYYAPNSCLQLGYISLTRDEIKEARQYFEKALAYPKHEYKNSIDSKARSALAQLKDFK